MIRWTGHGWLGAGFLIVGFVGTEKLFGEERMFQLGPLIVLLLATAAPCFVVGRWLNRGFPHAVFDVPKTVIDPQTGVRRIQNPRGHTLGGIRLEYAGSLVLLVLLFIWLKRAWS